MRIIHPWQRMFRTRKAYNITREFGSLLERQFNISIRAERSRARIAQRPRVCTVTGYSSVAALQKVQYKCYKI